MDFTIDKATRRVYSHIISKQSITEGLPLDVWVARASEEGWPLTAKGQQDDTAVTSASYAGQSIRGAPPSSYARSSGDRHRRRPPRLSSCSPLLTALQAAERTPRRLTPVGPSVDDDMHIVVELRPIR